jgi:hypothetical protein
MDQMVHYGTCAEKHLENGASFSTYLNYWQSMVHNFHKVGDYSNIIGN